MSTTITREELQCGLDATAALANTMVTKKYVEGDEKTLDDVLQRLCDIIDSRVGKATNRSNNPTKKFNYTKEEVEEMKVLLKQQLFIPGGSVLAGASKNPNKRSSLSNCYVLQIKHDSIESIFECMAEAARTYSYRGGCGIDLTTLRPDGSSVNNAAKTSSGAISFMPLLSSVNATIGQNGRRAAMMVSMDVRHPDTMGFVWSKADPESVFPRDHMSKDNTAKKLQTWLKTNAVPANLAGELNAIAETGKVPDVNTANISVKVTKEFMEAVKTNSRNPWVFLFPDIEADKEFYNKHWNGDYELWVKLGGKLKEYRSFTATVTRENYARFIGRLPVACNDPDANAILPLAEEDILADLDKNGGTFQIELINPTAAEIMYEIAMAAWTRGDPGVLFWDRHLNWSTFPYLDDKLRPVSTNPCGEIASYPGGSCLLGAHILHKYVVRPWEEDAHFDMLSFADSCQEATKLMNFFSDLNEDLHPLAEQRDMEKYAKRIGIEFTGLADALSMLGFKYGDPDSLDKTGAIMATKSLMEILTSLDLAKRNGPCPACDPKKNPEGLQRLLDSEYMKAQLTLGVVSYVTAREAQYGNLGDAWAVPFGQELKQIYYSNRPETAPRKIDPGAPQVQAVTDAITALIMEFGLRNVAFNTVGPTGTISIIAGNCSSGIEPVFALFTKRTTRVGDQKSYNVCHAPVAKHLLESEPDRQVWTLEEIKNRYNVVEAYELSPSQRIDMQRVVQGFCDSSISSTVNLDSNCTADDIFKIYLEAGRNNLKGITVFRNGSLDGVLEVMDKQETAAPELEEQKSDGLARGEVIDLPNIQQAERHLVHWNGCKLYVTVSTNEKGEPLELFISNLPREVSTDECGQFNSVDYQEKTALWIALTRSISVGLRAGVKVDEYVRQLQKAVYSMTDMMAVICRVLNRYTVSGKEKEKTIQEVNDMIASGEDIAEDPRTSFCPKCGEKTFVRTGGCNQCFNSECGYSKCD